VSDEAGRGEVYVTDFPRHSGRWQVSSIGGTAPAWSPDGRHLYFELLPLVTNTMDLMLMSASVDGRGDAPSIGTPRQVFVNPGPFAESNEYGRNYDVTPDGGRFVMTQRPQFGAGIDGLTGVLNWLDELPGEVSR
jgi:Tol biopolymer transport system component